MISTILRIDRNVNGRKQKNMLLLFYCTVIALALVSDTAADSILSICPPRHWISAQVDACVPCSTCTEADRIVVLRPCQLHQDTVCGTLNDLEFEWNNLLQHRHIGHDRPQSATDRTAATAAAASASLLASSSAAVVVTRTWEWQASSMAFAAIACLLFVSALVYILYQHAKQWRHMENMERRFDRGELFCFVAFGLVGFCLLKHAGFVFSMVCIYVWENACWSVCLCFFACIMWWWCSYCDRHGHWLAS